MHTDLMGAQIGRDFGAVLTNEASRLKPEIHGIQKEKAVRPFHEGQQRIALRTRVHDFHMVREGVTCMEPFGSPAPEAFIPVKDIPQPEHDDAPHISLPSPTA